ncbi:hypothetical protein CEXT_157211 [Caerostris extrusa]|uniref:Uncharacterized protein n=1 Tax=Caerostris extrusa TaxID=172846 RepID=A0AAV4Y0U4_CAEEX|nr:hypothetical protein CEXT_157211 [Caerostris extrusa]
MLFAFHRTWPCTSKKVKGKLGKKKKKKEMRERNLAIPILSNRNQATVVDVISLACYRTTTDAQTGRGGCCLPPSLLLPLFCRHVTRLAG